MQFSSNADGTSVTMRIPSTGFVRTFTGPNRDAVETQIKDFLLKDGLNTYARFIQVLNEQTLIGVVDGNPRATTAIISDHAFQTFGLGRTPLARLDNPTEGGVASPLRFDFEGGVVDHDEANENFFTGTLSTGILGKNLGVTFSSIFNYRNIEDSALWNLAFEIGVPFFIIPPQDAERSWSWQLTPTGSVGAGASYDLAAGGTFWGIGITSALSYRVDRLVFTLANQITYYDGFALNLGEYKFDTLVEQEVLKNGLGVAYLTSWGFIDGGIAYTNFLQDAAIDGYWSPTVGVGLTWGKASGFRVGYKGDFDFDGYKAHALEATLYFGF
jgi:hypothetical protein